jgi:DNA-binding protein HU-alpha
MMAKATTPKPEAVSKKPARSKTRAAATKPRATRKAAKSAVNNPIAEQAATAASEEIERVELSKKDLIERLVRDTEMKKGDARRALEAVLGVFAEALAEGANITASPLGKIKIARTKDTATGQLVVCRVKLKKPETQS